MNRKFILLTLILIFFISIQFSSASWFDDIEEHTDSIYISDLTTEFINHTDGWYIYTANFDINNLSSGHGITVVVSFWQGNRLVKAECDYDYENYDFDEDGDFVADYDSEMVLDKNYSADNYKKYLGESAENPDLKPIEIHSEIETLNVSDVTHVKIYIYDNTADKLLFKSTKKFNMSNQILVNDEENRIDDGSYTDAEFGWDSDDLELFDSLDSDKNHLITLKEFKKYDYFKGYTKSEIKEEFENIDSNNDNYITAKEFEVMI